MDEIDKRLEQIGKHILDASRNELYLHMRFFDIALSALDAQMLAGLGGIGTDGQMIYFDPHFLSERYRQNRIWVNRLYLHLIFHCIYRHLFKLEGRERERWNLACDIAVESVLDRLYHRIIRIPPSYFRQDIYRKLEERQKVLTAEGIYRSLTEMEPDEQMLGRLTAEFASDDHRFWPSDEERRKPGAQQLQKKWAKISEQTQTSMETLARGAGQGSEAVLDTLRVENRERYDYASFLRKFAVMKEEMQVDPDTFDYVFYTYGLSFYGNMPLIEPQEYKEVCKIEEFVIAIDTSMSCSGELVKAFLAETYAVLKNSESYFHKVNIHIIQCDEKIQEDKRITCEEELKKYMEGFEVRGSGGTDFRPVFTYVDKLIRDKVFSDLKGLLYFTDGLGIYPKKAPQYETAFIFMQEDYSDVDVPPWAIKLILEPEDIELSDAEKLRRRMHQQAPIVWR